MNFLAEQQPVTWQDVAMGGICFSVIFVIVAAYVVIKFIEAKYDK